MVVGKVSIHYIQEAIDAKIIAIDVLNLFESLIFSQVIV